MDAAVIPGRNTWCVRKVSDLRLYEHHELPECRSYRPDALRCAQRVFCVQRAFSVRRICLQFKMTERTDQRICIKFCSNLGKSCTKTIEVIQKAFVDESMGITHIKEVKKHVKVGAMSSQCWLFFSIVRVLCTTNLL